MKRIRDAAFMTAIKTPYLENRKFDLATFDRLVEKQIEGGVQGLIVGGTTGEGQLMDWDEHIMLIAHCVVNFSRHIIVVGNTGSNNTHEAVKATEQGFAVGMDAALQINPYYGKTSKDGLKANFERLLDIGPAIIYNVPARTAQDITPDIVVPLANHRNLVGMKECMGSERIGYYEEKGIACWSGNDNSSHESRHRCNSHGVISVTGNILPKTMRSLMDRRNDELNGKLAELFAWLFCEPNPVPLNTIMAMMKIVKPVFRLPYVPLGREARQQGLAIFSKLQLDDIYTEIADLNDDDFIVL